MGASTPAAAVVLAVYFSGLALGGALYTRLGARLGRPLVVYGVLEAFVGVCALFVWLGFGTIQAWSASAIQGAGDSQAALFTVRFLISCAWILPPTVAMGASFPAIVGTLSRMPEAGDARRTIALFYTLNLVGAILGTLGGAYWLLPAGGPGATLATCVAIEVVVCVLALWLDRSLGQAGGPQSHGATAAPAFVLDRHAVTVLSLGAISGFVFFAFEVIAVHLVGATIGTSAYAFADMLAAILVGMLISGFLVGSLQRKSKTLSETALGLSFAGAGLALALTTSAWDDVPRLFLKLRPDTFALGETYRFLIACAVLLPSAVALGAIYPLLFRLPWFDEERRESLAGALVAANAIGCFTGSMVGGFVMLSHLGSRTSLLVLAAALGVGALVIAGFSARRGAGRFVVAGLGMTAVALAAFAPAWDMKGLTAGTNVHFTRSHTTQRAKLLFLHEDAHGGITSLVQKPGRGLTAGPRVLLTNGKYQGDDGIQMPAQVGLAMVPLVHTSQINTALVIGLGTGHSAAVVADAGFRHVDIAELAPGIVAAARGPLKDLNGDVLGKPNVHLHLDDGRNFLLRTKQRYDMVTIELSSVWFAGATNVYALEFYEAAHRKLTDEGVLQQWVQMHHISREEVLATVLSARQVFPYVELFFLGRQGMMLMSKRPLQVQPTTIERLRAMPSMEPHLRVLSKAGFGKLEELPKWRVFDARDVNGLVAQFPDHVLNTDMNRFLEYATPRHQLEGGSRHDFVRSLLALVPTDVATQRASIILAKGAHN